MKLHYQLLGSGYPIVILHGLFGSSDNWRAVAKQLAGHAQVISVDLRNHGSSPHSPEQTYKLMAGDLAELVKELGFECVDIIGHSVGGKVAMAFSQYYAQYCRKLVVVDIAPKQYQQEHNAIFEALLALDLAQYSRRSEVDLELAKRLPNKAIRQFLLMNLDVSTPILSWKINLAALYHNYQHLLEPVCENFVSHTPCCIIRGSRSNYVTDQDEGLIRTIYPNLEFCTIEQAGHWVHADAPETFLTKVSEFLSYD